MSMIPMIIGNQEARKGISNVVKYALIFGGLGVGILLFIFFIKKFNPFKAVGGFFKKAGSNVGGFFSSMLGGLFRKPSMTPREKEAKKAMERIIVRHPTVKEGMSDREILDILKAEKTEKGVYIGRYTEAEKVRRRG